MGDVQPTTSDDGVLSSHDDGSSSPASFEDDEDNDEEPMRNIAATPGVQPKYRRRQRQQQKKIRTPTKKRIRSTRANHNHRAAANSSEEEEHNSNDDDGDDTVTSSNSDQDEPSSTPTAKSPPASAAKEEWDEMFSSDDKDDDSDSDADFSSSSSSSSYTLESPTSKPKKSPIKKTPSTPKEQTPAKPTTTVSKKKVAFAAKPAAHQHAKQKPRNESNLPGNDNTAATTQEDAISSLSSSPKITAHSVTNKKQPRALRMAAVRLEDCDAYDIRLSSTNTSTARDEYTTVLVQIHPEDAAHLDFTGATGVIGRLEVVNGERITLDLKGTQYAGRIYPGPTAMVLAAVHSNTNSSEPPYFKVEGMTDEFCSLTKIGDAMTQMNAVDAFGAMVDTSSYYNHNEDEDVNRPTTASASKQQEQQLDGDAVVPDAFQQKQKLPGKKRKRGPKSNVAPAKKKKTGKAKKR